MSEKLTRIRVLNQTVWSGLLEWGEHDRAHMIHKARIHAKQLKEEAEAVLNTKDADFDIAVVRGPIVQHLVRELKP